MLYKSKMKAFLEVCSLPVSFVWILVHGLCRVEAQNVNGNKGEKIMNIERTNGMGLRRSPRLTSAPPETKGRSSKTIFKSSDKGSYSETRSSGKLNGKRLCLSKTEEADKGTFPLRHNETNLRLIIERQLRRSLKFSQATKNGSSDISVRRLDMDEVVFSEEKLLGISPSSMHSTENGDSNASFREHRREMSDDKQLKTPSSLSTLLAEDETFSKKAKGSSLSGKEKSQSKTDVIFIGNPIPDDEAQERWRWRYEMKVVDMNYTVKCYFFDSYCDSDDDDDEDKVVWNVECHYAQAEIDGCTINLGDCVYIKGEEAKHHIGRILEFFKTTDGENYFRVQWFYRAEDTVMKQEAAFHDERRVFYSTVMNDNPIDCIISKVSVTQISPKLGLKSNSLPRSDFYFDMEYCVDYSTFHNLPPGKLLFVLSYSSSNCCKEVFPSTPAFSANIPSFGTYQAELTLLDLYSGCGGMSTGLCLGAKASSIDLVTVFSSNQC
ncbi:hypothetical protein Goshw_017633 [Gossypium schwendimanii]|uniref:BAH domain-containing protein n=1 Tax=Gossypium schwendimanii TaxID=34291 RepID=A0A7J9L416_GOSSC|nr:hypothetical protein [Gossypium schwendimanii]